jgi:hypothetical protein
MVKRHIVHVDSEWTPMVMYDDYAALAERCERLEAALRSLRSMCADNLELGAEGPAYWEDCGDVINEALSGSSGGKDG